MEVSEPSIFALRAEKKVKKTNVKKISAWCNYMPFLSYGEQMSFSPPSFFFLCFPFLFCYLQWCNFGTLCTEPPQFFHFRYL